MKIGSWMNDVVDFVSPPANTCRAIDSCVSNLYDLTDYLVINKIALAH